MNRSAKFDFSQVTRYPLQRHQPESRIATYPVPEYLLRSRPGRKPHQGVEDPSRGRPHLMLAGQRQPDAPVPAYRRVLADVEFLLPDASSLTLARHPVRYLAPAPDQTGRPGRDTEEINSPASAAINAGSGRSPLRSGQTAQVAGLRSGAVAPTGPDLSHLQRRHTAEPSETSSHWPANQHTVTTSGCIAASIENAVNRLVNYPG